MKKFTILLIITIYLMNEAFAQTSRTDKITVYQVFTRLFGNTNTTNAFNGTLEQNGTGKFNDINNNALKSLNDLGITHVWYTGVIEHATMTGFPKEGLMADHPQIVKGIAGSPYAIKDYYDVNPYLAEKISNRMLEFEQLIARTHKNGMKVLIDFVPNHVSRQYKSDVKPIGIKDFGEDDNTNAAFLPNNNFYYIPNQAFQIPDGINPPIKFEKDYTEYPAKATGNDVFSAKPSINDWFETLKLNYGVDYLNGRNKHFEAIPDTWLKMKDILSYWTKKGVDGFRCDMAEMVPVEFWAYVIPEIKKLNPDIIFIAEIYNPNEYRNYIFEGKFDYLYDKVGLYDALRRLVEGHGNANEITQVWQRESGNYSNHMLRFLENHDEQRIASNEFGKNPESALAAMMLSSTLHTGPVMIYSGQELGVKPTQSEGFQGNDGRTTIFDFWGLTEMQDWINGGKFDTKTLRKEVKGLRDFYKNMLNFSLKNEAVSKGAFHDLQYLNGHSIGYDQSKIYAYLRYTKNQMLLFVYNFDLNNEKGFELRLPQEVVEKELNINHGDNFVFKQIFNGKEKIKTNSNSINLTIAPNSFKIYEIQNLK